MATVRVFFDVTADGAPVGKVIMEVSFPKNGQKSVPRAKYEASRQLHVHVTGGCHGGEKNIKKINVDKILIQCEFQEKERYS